MARPIKVFTDEEAKNIVNVLYFRHASKSYLFKDDMRTEADYFAGVEALKHMFNRDEPSTPESVRAWIDTYMSDEGWTRVQAAMRQHKKKISNCDQLTLMSRDASNHFQRHAENCGVTKKDYLNEIASWLAYDDVGRVVAKDFAARLKAKRDLITNKLK